MKKVFLCFIFVSVFVNCALKHNRELLNIELFDTVLTGADSLNISTVAAYELNFYNQIFDNSKIAIKIKLFGDSSSYRQYQKKNSSARSSNGFYSQSRKEIVVYKNTRFLRTIYHEMNHLILRNHIPIIPKWLNEGLSEYFEYAEVINDSVRIELQKKKANRLRKWVLQENKIYIEDFLTWTNERWKKENFKPDFYSSTLSWGLITFLMQKSQNRALLIEIIKELDKGSDALTLLETYYPGGVKVLQSDFLEFIASDLPIIEIIEEKPNKES